ncbi:MAG TPA: ABC transporter permease [Candidatus Saccharimonadales bacterium]|nr:ABC transporter permease [Candidatus Saccharimonadales bacterium]
MTWLLRQVTAITVKELRQLRRDPVSLLLTILFPIMLIGIFIALTSVFSATSYNIAVGVVDLDNSPSSKALMDRLTTSSVIRVTEIFQSEQQAFDAVNNGQVVGSVIIPKGFGTALAQGQAFVITDTDNSKVTSSGLILGELQAQTSDLLLKNTQRGNQLGVKNVAVEVIWRPISGRPITTGDPYLPGLLGMIILLGAFDDIVNAICRERERGTFPRLTLTPTSLFAIYSGKMAATVVLTIIRTAVMLVILRATGMIIRGSIPLVFLTTALIGTFTLAAGLVISSRIRSSATLTFLEIAMTFPLLYLAGVWSAPLMLDPTGKLISLSLPWTYGNDALRRIMFLGLGLNSPSVSGDLLILLTSTLILLPLALLLSKRTM